MGSYLEDDVGITVSFKDRRKYSIFYANENDLEGGNIDEASDKELLEPLRMISSGQAERMTRTRILKIPPQ